MWSGPGVDSEPVLDLETTGTSPANCMITELMVADAPRIESMTPSLLKFIGDSVVLAQ